MFALGGKWNEYLDAQRCDEEGNPLPDAETLHLWKVRDCCPRCRVHPPQQEDGPSYYCALC